MVSVRSGLTIQSDSDFDAAQGDGRMPSLAREEWDNLLRDAASNVVFMTWEWQRAWWRHFGSEEGCRLHLLSLRDERGALVGIAPLFIEHAPLPPLKEYARGEQRPVGEGEPLRIVRIVGGIEVADYLDVIAPVDRLPEVWATVLDYLLDRRGEWDVIDFHSLPDFSPSREILPALAEARGLDCRVFPEDVSPVLQLPGDWDTYLMGLRKKDRHELRRKVRKLEGRDDVKWHLVPSKQREAMTEGMRTFLDLHRLSGADKATFMDDKMASYFLDMASSLCETGWLDLAILDVAGEPASAYFSFSYGHRLYLYNSGYDPQFASYSAGVALLAYRIHKAILEGYKHFDFLRGDEPYKYDFGAKDTYVYRAFLSPMRET